MCFSAGASFTAGISLVAVGALTIRKAERKAEMPLAMIPLLFGVQQVSEGVLWLSFEPYTPLLNRAMTTIFSIFSHVLWPIFVPFATLLIEPSPQKKRVLYAFQVMGILVGIYLIFFMIVDPITSRVVERSILYESPHFYVVIVMLFFFLATGVTCFVSSHRIVHVLGMLILISALLAYQIKALAFVSVWCFFAAMLSFVVYLYFHSSSRIIHGSATPWMRTEHARS